MKRTIINGRKRLIFVLLSGMLFVYPSFTGMEAMSLINSRNEHSIYVSTAGCDQGKGTRKDPFRTIYRAQQAARNLTRTMKGNIIIFISAGDYRLDRTLEFTEEDSGQKGFHVIYRSSDGPGKARLLGSTALKGWIPDHDGIWMVKLSSRTLFHTLYENGVRVHKARFPDLEFIPEMPVALGRYLVSVDGSPKVSDKVTEKREGPGWLIYGTEDIIPVTNITKMRIHIYAGGTWDWAREIHYVTSIDRQARRIVLDVDPARGVGVGARFFLEDELGFLNVPGEFFLDEKAQMLYYKPLGKGNPDDLNITYSVLNRLIQVQGKSREQCARNIIFDGLSLGETDDNPPEPLWATAGRQDGALIWMSNTSHIEIRNCHLRNSGRSGIMMIGQNINNLVEGCLIEHMALNGVSLCNSFRGPDGKPTTDSCENNHVYNTRISHIGELHSYAECITLFNVSNNEIDHCQLDNSVRYAVTLRGNTGPQYGPPISTDLPPTKGNRIHHVYVSRCGQDGGDMGALHCANLNNPGGGCVNTFEQVVVADTRAIPSVKDQAPDGIFLDWPKMSMDQVFSNVQIVRAQGKQLRSHQPENGASAKTTNVSWQPDFNPSLMDYENIGLKSAFPYGGRPNLNH